MSEPVLLRVDGLEKYFPVHAGLLGRQAGSVRAVDGVSFEVRRGHTLGLVGESGCGKTTVGQSVVRLLEPSGGRVLFEGRDITHMAEAPLRELRRHMQIVFQDPFSSLNPRMTVADIVGEALEVHGLAAGRAVEERVARTLERVGIPSAWINRYPHEFSGGQRQRISIARAIALDPRLIVCDEAVSALDVSIQAQVLNLLIELQREMDLAYLFISHDLSVVRHVSDEVAVMYLGQIVESAPADELFARPAHPYSRSLLSAIPVPDPRRRAQRQVLEGDVPSPLDPPAGCRFHTRCPAVLERCRSEEAPAFAVDATHRVKCWHAEGLLGAADWYRLASERSEAAVAQRRAAQPLRPAPAAVSRFALAAAADVPAGAPVAASRPAGRAGSGRARAVLAWSLMSAGLLSIVTASAVAGLWLYAAGAALWLWLRRGGTRALRLGVLAIVVVGFTARVPVSGWQRVRLARSQYEALGQALEARHALAGAYPLRLPELGWRLAAIDPKRVLRDPWGRAWLYRTPGSGGRPYDLGSFGPDGLPGGGDDIGHPFEAVAVP